MASSNIFSNLFSGVKAKAGALLPPSFIKKTAGTISNPAINRTNDDLTTLRNAGDQKSVIRALSQNSPDMSMAVSTKARFAITDTYTVIAYSLDGRIDVPATITANTVAARLDRLRPDFKSYHTPNDFRSLSERKLKQLQLYGSFGAELVLGKGGVPSHISVFSTRLLKYEQKGDRAVPYIEQNAVKYYLDSPLVTIQDLDQDVETPYSESPLMSATQPIIADFEFVNDLRRAFSKANLPRPTAQILTEKFMESLPPDVRHDKAKLNEAMGEAINAIKQELNGLNPEDCLVYFDLISVEHLSAGNISSHSAVKEHKELLNGKVSAGLHTLPSILGRGENSTAASTEAMAYLRAVEGEQEKLNASFSYLLTMATRLMGHDVYVDFVYADPELRPKSELAAFKSMKQSLTLELLSFGFISDEEASITMTGSLPSGNFEPLSGTRFRDNTPAETEDNAYSNTSVTGEGINDTKSGKDQKAGNQKPSSNRSTGQ